MKSIIIKPKMIKLLFLTLVIASIVVSCSTNTKKTSSIPTEFRKKPITQIGSINNPRYFGKQFGANVEVETVAVEGRSQIVASGDRVAFDSALEAAMRNAVEIVLGTMVDSKAIVDKGVLIEDKIYARAYGFVKTYKVLNEYNKNNIKFLNIEATVVVGDVRDDAMALGVLQDRANRPILLVLIDEKNSSGELTSFFKTALEEKLIEKQFEFVNYDQLLNVLKKQNTTLGKVLNNQNKKITLGIETGAQIMITGKVTAIENDLSKNKLFKGKNLKSVDTTISLNAFNLGDARLFSARQESKTGIALNVDIAQKNALENLADKVGEQVIDDFLKKWDLYLNNGFEYQVIINGISFKESQTLKRTIQKRVQGIKAVFDRGYNENIFTLLIRFQGKINELILAMTTNSKTDLNLKLKNYNQQTVFFYQ